MGTSKERVARRLLKRRVLTQMETHFASTLTEVAGLLSVTDIPPEPENYFSLIQGETAVLDYVESPVFKNSMAVLVVTQPPGYFFTQQETESPNERRFTRDIEMDVTVVHRHHGYDAMAWLTVDDLEREAEIELWCDIYAGAILDIMRDHVRCDPDNFTVDFLEQRSAVEMEIQAGLHGEGSWARVTVPFTITQTVLAAL